jgi:predicted Zn-dependent peptidase
MSQIHKFELSNGVRVLVEPVHYVKSAAIGLWCKTGSRHEEDREAGITHLIEHMLFKGTKNRTAKEIAESIEGRGGSMNAFTDKESTCYYCRVLHDDVANAVEVLSDMMRHSKIDPDDLALEKDVVLEEIKRSHDEPSDLVHELHLTHRWGQHPLGKPIIGTPDSVSSFEQTHLNEYMQRRYRSENVVLSVAGNVNPETVRDQAEILLGDIESGAAEPALDPPKAAVGRNHLAKDVEQMHFCIGTDGVSIYDDDLYTLAVLDTALGGSMSSRLFQEIREKRGLAYSIGAYTLTYTTGGSFTVYGGCSPAKFATVNEVVQREFDSVRKDGLQPEELARTKRLIAGHMMLGLEGMNGRMMRMSRNEIFHGRDIPLEETLQKIEAVSNVNIITLANRLLASDQISVTTIGPEGA